MKLPACLLFALAALLLARPSRAHDPFEITTVVRAGELEIVVESTMAGSSALRLIAPESERRASITPESFQRHRAKLEEAARSFTEIASNKRALAVKATSARLTEEGDVAIAAVHEAAGGTLTITATHLGLLPEGYTNAFSASEGGSRATRFKVLTAADPVFLIETGVRPGASPVSYPTPEGQEKGRFAQFLALGIEHVLTGFDHLLFLLGVLLAFRTPRSLLALISCFTVAHSLTLALSTLGHVSVPAQIVEPLIAASIVFVALDNLRQQAALQRRLAVTFLFGLVHGLGFAGALGELELGGGLPLALFSFNLGIELGQLAVAALAVPLLLKLRRATLGPRLLGYSSVALAGIGCLWLVERLAS